MDTKGNDLNFRPSIFMIFMYIRHNSVKCGWNWNVSPATTTMSV